MHHIKGNLRRVFIEGIFPRRQSRVAKARRGGKPIRVAEEDMKHQVTLRERLNQLGYRSYAQYLRSKHWSQLRKLYFSKQYNPKLCFCGSSKVELHHRTYERLGEEKFKDLIPLCRQHHHFLHHKIKCHWTIGWEEDLDLDCLNMATAEYLEQAKKSLLQRPF